LSSRLFRATDFERSPSRKALPGAQSFNQQGATGTRRTPGLWYATNRPFWQARPATSGWRARAAPSGLEQGPSVFGVNRPGSRPLTDEDWQMIFNSWVFLAFFSIVYTLYLLTRRHLRLQNLVLLVASYVFYGFWDWRFLSLLFASTVIDFFAGRAMAASQDERRRRLFLAVSMSANLGMLGFFKYFNFFAESTTALLNALGMQADFITLNILLPAGISFYTFQTMSYGIDIYRRKLQPTQRFLDFMLFVSFFPHLVAGPIMRATALLPQFTRKRHIRVDQVNAGLFLILWGYFKKVVVADNLAVTANNVFNNYQNYQGMDLLLGILAFTFQIYGDFSGYTDIARGISKLMGFELNLNFNLPYLAANPSDFWERWHISLSSWLRDYLYIPLGGNRCGSVRTYRNLFLTMLLGGLWHGAAWNFVVWGAYHGLILCAFRRLDPYPEHLREHRTVGDSLRLAAKVAFMFMLTVIGWVIFRSGSLEQIAYMLTHVGFGDRSWTTVSTLWRMMVLISPLLLVQGYQYFSKDLLILSKWKPLARVPVYAFLLLAIILLGSRQTTEFIYFQF
jgi:D-alanyl-lipoteichoic acid acyltransferase DltB (MBOAT superfamily)